MHEGKGVWANPRIARRVVRHHAVGTEFVLEGSAGDEAFMVTIVQNPEVKNLHRIRFLILLPTEAAKAYR